MNANAQDEHTYHGAGNSGGDAYDDATLALEKSETLVALLMAVGGQGAQTVMDSKTLGRAIAHLSEYLADVRGALRRMGDTQ